MEGSVAKPTHYRGADRRASGQTSVGRVRPWVSGLAALAVVGILLGLVRPVADLVATPDTASAEVALLVVAAGLALSCWFHWRATGIAASAWVLGAAASTMAGCALGLFLGPLEGSAPALVSAVAGMHVLAAASTAEIDTRVVPHRVITWGALAALIVALVASLLVDSGREAALVVAGLVWFTAGATGGWRHWQRGSVLLGWVGVASLVVGLGEFVQLGMLGGAPVTMGALLQVTGLGAMAVGTSFDLARVVEDHRGGRLASDLTHLWDEESRRLATEDRNHDLGNSLMAVEGAALTLAHHADQLTSEEREQLVAALVRGARDVRGLAYAALDDAELIEKVDLLELVQHQVALLRASGGAFVIDASGPVFIEARESEVQQVVQNLLVNAVRHGGASPAAPARVRVRHDNETALLVVEDDGPGVPDAVRDSIFDRGVCRSSTDGHGLGLAVARRLARGHGGDVRLARGHGARFEFHMPVRGAGS